LTRTWSCSGRILKRFARNTQAYSMVRRAKASESAQFVHAAGKENIFVDLAEKHRKKRSLVRFTEGVAIQEGADWKQ